MYSQCINAGIPVYPTENYCTNLVNNAELSKNLQTLKQLIDKGLKVALIHNENLRFHENFSTELLQLVNSNKDKFLVFAEGIDDSFPFSFKQHNDLCLRLQHQQKQLPRVDHTNKTKDLLVLVRRDDANRINLVKKLESLQLLDNSYVSVNAKNCVYTLEDDHENYQKDSYRLSEIPYIPHYANSKLSVVMETNMVEKSYQLSEKIYKPIMTEHPFVVLGPPGYLKFLHSHGYETFGDWIDESYDNEQDISTRILLIANACNKFLKSDINNFYHESAIIRRRNREKFFNTIPISLQH